MSPEADPTRTTSSSKGRVGRRLFWSMLGVATVAPIIAGIIAALVGQNIVAQEVRTEMIRQAVAVEALLADRLEEDADASRVLVEVLQEERDVRIAVQSASNRGRTLFQLVTSARRLLGSPLVDLAFVNTNGSIQYLSDESEQSLVEHVDSSKVIDGMDQFVTIPAAAARGDLPFLVYVRPVKVIGFEDSPNRLAILVARQTAFVDIGRVLRGMLMAFGVATLLSAVFSRVLARRITRRLDGLATASAALAAGDVTARAPVQGDDEVTEVARSFNDMAKQLEDLHVHEREFLMSVGHDLRTPLTTIAGYAEVLEEGNLADGETGRIAGVLANETSLLRRLVEDLMLLARLEAHEFTLEEEEVDVAAHIWEVVDAFGPRAEVAHVKLEHNIETTGKVTTDPDRLAQILGNLIENALRYTPEAGTVTVNLRPVGAEVEMTVTDTGSGIDPGDIPKVFEKFYVARHYRRVRPEGSGLGLSIVKQLVDALGGRVAVTSDLNVGTTVWVRLPGLRTDHAVP